MRGRYTVRITPADIGQRVTIRIRTHASEGQPSATDVLGILRSWDKGVLRVERRDGRIAEIPVADLLAARVIPSA